MVEERPLCPECKYQLASRVLKDDETGEITIEYFCDEAGEDIFRFQILTGLTVKDIAEHWRTASENSHDPIQTFRGGNARMQHACMD